MRPQKSFRNKVAGKRGPSTLTAEQAVQVAPIWREIGRIIGYAVEEGKLPAEVPSHLKNIILTMNKFFEDEASASLETKEQRCIRLFDESVDWFSSKWKELREGNAEHSREIEAEIRTLSLELARYVFRNFKIEVPAELLEEFTLQTKQSGYDQHTRRAISLLEKIFPAENKEIPGLSRHGYEKRLKLRSNRSSKITLTNGYFHNLCALDPDKGVLIEFLKTRAQTRTYFDYCGMLTAAEDESV